MTTAEADDVTIEEWTEADQAPEGGEGDCEGAGEEHLESAGNAASRGWGRGWPHCQSGKLRVVVVKRSVRLAVREEIAPLVGWLCAETMRRGYPLRTGQCWGFACRAIRGSSTPSNHSWGLAVDLNSLANPMGPRLVTDMPDWMPRLWKNHGFRWGGTYSSRKDAMHYEYMLTPRAAKATARRLEPVGSKRAAKPAPGRRKAPAAGGVAAPRFPLPAGHYYGVDDGTSTCHDGSRPEDRDDVQRFQRRMIARGWDLGPDGADGFVGEDTQTAVTSFQQEKGLEDDGLVGPATWSAFWRAPVTS